MKIEFLFEELGLPTKGKQNYVIGAFSGTATIEITSKPQREYHEVHGRDIPVDHGLEWEVSKIRLESSRYNTQTKEWDIKKIECPKYLEDKIMETLTSDKYNYASGIDEECLSYLEVFE